MQNGTESQNATASKKEKTAAEPIIVPIVLRMAEFDHKVCDIYLSINMKMSYD